MRGSMTAIIAEAAFIGEHPSRERFPIHVRVEAPTLHSSGEWSCLLAIGGLHDNLLPMRGEDALQALSLALGLAGSLLRDFVSSGGRLLYADGSDAEVPIDSYFGPFTAGTG